MQPGGAWGTFDTGGEEHKWASEISRFLVSSHAHLPLHREHIRDADPSQIKKISLKSRKRRGRSRTRALPDHQRNIVAKSYSYFPNLEENASILRLERFVKQL